MTPFSLQVTDERVVPRREGTHTGKPGVVVGVYDPSRSLNVHSFICTKLSSTLLKRCGTMEGDVNKTVKPRLINAVTKSGRSIKIAFLTSETFDSTNKETVPLFVRTPPPVNGLKLIDRLNNAKTYL